MEWSWAEFCTNSERKWSYELTSRCFEGILDNTNLKKFGTLHEFACHPCAAVRRMFSVEWANHTFVWKSLTNRILSISIKVTNRILSISINQTKGCDWPIWANKNNKPTTDRSLTFEILNQKVGFSKKRPKKFIERARDQRKLRAF